MTIVVEVFEIHRAELLAAYKKIRRRERKEEAI